MICEKQELERKATRTLLRDPLSQLKKEKINSTDISDV